jgi:hypothetical protein
MVISFFIWRAPDIKTFSEFDCEQLLGKDNYELLSEVLYKPNSLFIDFEGIRYYLMSSIPRDASRVYLDLHYSYDGDFNRILSGGLDVSWVRWDNNMSSKIPNSATHGYIYAHVEQLYIHEMARELSMNIICLDRPAIVLDNEWIQKVVPGPRFG